MSCVFLSQKLKAKNLLRCTTGKRYHVDSNKLSLIPKSMPPLLHCANYLCGEGNGTPLQYSCLENPMEGGAWWLQSMGSLRVGHDWETSHSLFTFMHWRRKWQPTPVFLPGESQGRGSLVGCPYGVAQSWTRLRWLSSSSSNYLWL